MVDNKYCQFCGAQIPTESLFCLKCGATLTAETKKRQMSDEEIAIRKKIFQLQQEHAILMPQFHAKHHALQMFLHKKRPYHMFGVKNKEFSKLQQEHQMLARELHIRTDAIRQLNLKLQIVMAQGMAKQK